MNCRWMLIVACLAQTAEANPVDDLKDAFNNTKNWFQKNLNSKDATETDSAEQDTPEKKAETKPEVSAEPAAERRETKAQTKPAEKTVSETKPWIHYLYLEKAEDKDLLVEIVEEVNFGHTTLISNELSLGLFFGKNLLTSHLAFMYGSTALSHEQLIDDNVATEFEADHKGLGYGLRFSREIMDFFYPYLGVSRAHFKSDISQKLRVREDEDSLAFPLMTYDLNQIDMTALDLGVDARVHFWKLFTVGAGAGVEFPIKVVSPRYKDLEALSNPEFTAAIDELATKLKQPMMHVNLHFGLAF